MHQAQSTEGERQAANAPLPTANSPPTPRTFHNLVYSNWERFTFWSSTVILATKCISSLVCLILTVGQKCDQPLTEFLQVFSLLAILQFTVNIVKKVETPPESPSSPNHPTPQSRTLRYAQRSATLIEAVSILWLFFGSAWILGCKTCHETAPTLYYTAALWIIYGYVLVAAPLIVFSLIICIIPAGFLVASQVKQRRKEAAAKKMLLKMPVLTYDSDPLANHQRGIGPLLEGSMSSVDSSIDCCSICLSGFKAQESIRLLPCSHYFHQQCGDRWLMAHAKCPLCLSNIA